MKDYFKCTYYDNNSSRYQDRNGHYEEAPERGCFFYIKISSHKRSYQLTTDRIFCFESQIVNKEKCCDHTAEIAIANLMSESQRHDRERSKTVLQIKGH